MIFNSFQFIWLFPTIFILYWGINFLFKNRITNKINNLLLIFTSYSLYISYKPIYALLLVYVTLITYWGGKILYQKDKSHHRSKYLIMILSVLTLLPLLTFKYYNFFNESLTQTLQTIGIHIGLPGLNWAIPIGISFFTFQALGYLFDVYYKKVEAEKKLVDYMLFICFFPQIASGPISKSKDLLPQIKRRRNFNYEKVVEGCKWLLWGMFLKVVVADRIGTLVDTILPNYAYLNGTTCFIGATLYSIQIYSDFGGYSFMAIGVGQLMGFNLINNFQRPYFAATVTEFWKRWHISLTKWLTDYVYIPLGGNRCSKTRMYINILITFLVSGIWHGANWTYIMWGIIHGTIQSVEKALGIQKCSETWMKPFRILFTFILITFAWIIFRMPTINEGWDIIYKIFTDFGYITLKSLKTDNLLIFIGLSILIIKEWFEEYHNSITLINNKHIIIRWFTYITLICIILLCGVFDAGSFIYVSF